VVSGVKCDLDIRTLCSYLHDFMPTSIDEITTSYAPTAVVGCEVHMSTEVIFSTNEISQLRWFIWPL